MGTSFISIRECSRQVWIFVPVFALALIACGCGGGSAGGAAPPTPDFLLAVNPTSVSIPAGGAMPVSLSVTALNGFSSQVSVQVAGLPPGVSATPANITLTPSTPQQVSLSATSGSAANTVTATFTGTAGSLSHAATLNVSVTAAPDFGLAVNPTSVSIPAGSSMPVSASVTALNGFSAQVSVQVTGLPSGVTANPASLTLTPGTPQQISLSATTSAPVISATATLTGTAGTLSHTAALNVSVTKGNPASLPTRTKYLRTDAVTEYYLWVNTHWAVFHPPTSRFFVTDPTGNQVLVLDSVSLTLIGSVPVPGAFGMDDTPDHSTLYVGTVLGDIYSVDPVAMQVKQRYLASEIGPYGFSGTSALVLSDGRLALLGAQGGFPSVDGSINFAIWNPADNSIVIYGGAPLGAPSQPDCVGNIGGFTRSADRTAVFVGSIDSDGTLCELIPATGQKLTTSIGGFSTTKIVVSPDGRYLAFVVYPNQVVLYDVHTLNRVAAFTPAGDTSSASGLVFSADSQTLFVPNSSIVYAYDVATQAQTGWLPNIIVEYTQGGLAAGPAVNPVYEVTEGTGLLCGPLEEGFGCLDTTKLQTGPVGAQFVNAYLNPATGPTSGGTQVEWQDPVTVNAESKIYFGGSLGTFVSNTGVALTVTTPPNSPGPADVYVFTSDGGMQLIPEAFSYGPTILEVAPGMSTAEGGGTGIVYGYGFGPVGATSIPPDLKVSVGGQPASITAFNPNAYGLSSPPFLLQAFSYNIPSGPTGTAAVTVTTSSGSATAQGGLTYFPATRQFPLPGSVLVQGIYDPVRDVYYFTDSNRVQVFSLTQGKWLSPLTIPAPAGATQRLWGIALSPDGTHLAVADAQALVVYVLDAGNPSSVQTFPIAPFSQGIIGHPIGVAISDSGIVYITVFVEGGDGFYAFFKLDTSSGKLTSYPVDGPQLFANGAPLDVYLRTVISQDNSRVFFNDDGYVFSIDTATDDIFSATTDQGCCYGDYDLAFSRNQTNFEASSYLYDSDLNAESFLTLNDREILNIGYVYGAKLSPDGRLLFQPSTNGIDVFDGHIGTLRNRIALPFSLSANYDALVEDGKDNVLIAVTGTNGNGIAVVDLSSISEPPPLPYSTASSGMPRRWMRAERFSRTKPPNATANRPASRSRSIPHVANPSPLLHR